MFHDHETPGHPGELETYNLVKVHYWWPGMRMFERITYKDAVTVNNSKSTTPQPILLTNQLLGPKPPVPLQTVPWT